MENLTAQQVFDRVSDHLLTQKKKSLRPKSDWIEADKPECAYRGVDGLKCAVGCLFTDEDMKIVKENTVVGVYENKFETIRTNYSMLDELQSIHDTKKPSRWIEKLAVLAKKYNIDASVLKKYRKTKAAAIPVEMKPLTRQAIFDKVATHLLTQKKKSLVKINEGSYIAACAYRGDNGTMCAVGCLLTDNDIKLVKEGDSSDVVCETITRLGDFRDILYELQHLHDAYKPSKWINKLSLLATRECLNKDVLKQFRKVTK